MDVVTDLSGLPHQGETHVCVLAPTGEEALARAGAELLDFPWPREERRLRRPSVIVTDGEVDFARAGGGTGCCRPRSSPPVRRGAGRDR